MREKIRYYKSYTDDFDTSQNQEYKLKPDYKWVKNDIFSKTLSGIVYFCALVFGSIYCRFVLKMRIKGKAKVKGFKGDYFLFANHTQPIGDVVIPAFCVLPKRIFTIVSPANFGIPFIGKILPYLGALPISETISGTRELTRAIEFRRSKNHPIVIYPEAHVWEYCSFIRPYPDTSFKYPVKLNKASFCITTVYNKSKRGKRPLMKVYIDGPFYPTGDTIKEKAKDLKEQIYNTMVNRAESGDVKYIEYKKSQDL
ncbi:MAG: 1-acyl-sn-glycerol-3-phosphate acyltransferase [Clostridia bacterium]|nr:1-acyl-sn-glycerol-3-phosphate acyltransferase [Clostridia bacterium]